MSKNVLTVSQFARKHEAFSESGLRWLLFRSADNGLDRSGAILRVGRRVLIDEDLFFEWLHRKDSVSKTQRVSA